MQAEDLVLNDGCEWQIIEELRELFPHVGVAVLAKALIIEAVHLGDLSALVITPEDRDSVLEAHFKGHEQRHCLDRVIATIDVVTHEKIVRVGGLSTDLEQLAEVVELSVDIATNGHWGAHLLHI
jgi:ActR/RegA family two-component response regulator